MKSNLNALARLVLLSMVVAVTASAQKSTGNYITVQDIETVTALKGVQLVPYNASKGAGGDFNFANKNGDLILMVQKMAGRKMYESNKSQTRNVKELVPGLGDEAFIGPPGNYPYFLIYRKGDTSVSLATYPGIDGKTRLTIKQLIALGKLIASRI